MGRNKLNGHLVINHVIFLFSDRKYFFAGEKVDKDEL